MHYDVRCSSDSVKDVLYFGETLSCMLLHTQALVAVSKK